MSNIFRCILDWKEFNILHVAETCTHRERIFNFVNVWFLPTSYKTDLGSADDSERDEISIHK